MGSDASKLRSKMTVSSEWLRLYAWIPCGARAFLSRAKLILTLYSTSSIAKAEYCINTILRLDHKESNKIQNLDKVELFYDFSRYLHI